MSATPLVLLRHGESEWNKSNLFTGWTDVNLSDQGVAEAHNAGKLLKEHGFYFETAFTSVLKRAIKTLWLTLEEMDLEWIPIYKAWQLNERHYGALQGLNKAETAAKYGEDQVHIWRRSYDIKPPGLSPDDPRFPGQDPRYRQLEPDMLPATESLKDTVNRFIPYWQEQIAPLVIEGKRIIIAAHGNTLRALVKYLDRISDADISNLNIPTGVPLVYELSPELIPVTRYYLKDSAEIEKRHGLI